MICEGLLPSHDLYGTSPSSDNSPADAHTQEFTIASCLTVYHRAEQPQPRVELDLEITAGIYNMLK